MALFNGDIRLGARLLLFDYFDAALTTWIDFLELVRHQCNRRSRSHHYQHNDDRMPVMGDRHHVEDFAKATRDLIKAMDTTVEAIKVMAPFEEDRHSRFEYLLIKYRARVESLKSTMNDVENYMDAVAICAQQFTNESQASSLKRLTLVASVFLPLTMACSLLSMTTRVNELGPIWWDWFGIVTTLGVVIVAGYRTSAFLHRLWRGTRVSRFMTGFRYELRRAQQRVQKRRKKELHKPRQHRLVPLSTRLLFTTTKYVFAVGVITSFLVGMFVRGGDVAIGAQSLGYSSAGAVGAFIISIVTWRLLKRLFYKAWHRKEEQSSNSVNEAGSTTSSVSKSATERSDSIRHSGQKTKTSIIRRMVRRVVDLCMSSICRPLVKFFLMIPLYLFALIFGTLLLEVIEEMVKKYRWIGGFGVDWSYTYKEGFNVSSREPQPKMRIRLHPNRQESPNDIGYASDSSSGADSEDHTQGRKPANNEDNGRENDIERDAGCQVAPRDARRVQWTGGRKSSPPRAHTWQDTRQARRFRLERNTTKLRKSCTAPG
jgi:hypothetical protein